MIQTFQDISGAYIVSGDLGQSDLSPVIVSEDGSVVIAAQTFRPGLGSVNGYMSIEGVTDQVSGKTYDLDLLFQQDGDACSFSGTASDRSDVLSQPVTFDGGRLFPFQPPGLDTKYICNAVFDVIINGLSYQDNLTIKSKDGLPIIVGPDMSLRTGQKAQAPTAFGPFASKVTGRTELSVGLQTNSQLVFVDSDGVLVAPEQGEGKQRQSAFDFWLTTNGTVLITWLNPANSETYYVALSEQGQLTVVSAESLEPAMEFLIDIETFVDRKTWLLQWGIDTDDELDSCDLAKIKLAWQFSGQLFLALGAGPFLIDGKAKVGLYALMKTNSKVAAVLTKIETAFAADKIPNTAALSVLGAEFLEVLFHTDMFWPVLKFVAWYIAWEFVLVAVAKVLEVFFATPVATAHLIGSITAWTLELTKVGGEFYDCCVLPDLPQTNTL
jgi:hypothetical protein